MAVVVDDTAVVARSTYVVFQEVHMVWPLVVAYDVVVVPSARVMCWFHATQIVSLDALLVMVEVVMVLPELFMGMIAITSS
jgi:hypothetical protein